MKAIFIFTHAACEPPGYLAQLLDRMAYPYRQLCLSKGMPMPDSLDNCAALVFMGGAGDVNQPTDWMLQEMDLIRQADQQGIPILGICLGAQLMSLALGGEVWQSEQMEVGWHQVELLPAAQSHPWVGDLDKQFSAFHWHAHVFSPPPGAQSLARSHCTECQGFIQNRHLAIQFHLEMTEEIILELLQKYASDLDGDSDCVQQLNDIKQDLSDKCAEAFRVADVLITRWFKALYE